MKKKLLSLVATLLSFTLLAGIAACEEEKTPSTESPSTAEQSSNTDSGTDTNTDTDTDSSTDTHTDTDADTDTDSSTDTHTDTDADTDTDSSTDTHTDTDADNSTDEEEPPIEEGASEGLEYSLTSHNGEYAYIVTGMGICQDTEVVIPSYFNGKKVIGLGWHAVYSNTITITRIVLPDYLEYVAAGAISSDAIEYTAHNNGYYLGSKNNPYMMLMEIIDKTNANFTIPKETKFINSLILYSFAVESISVEEENGYFKSIDGNLYSKDGTRLIRYAAKKTETEFTLPNTVTEIDDDAFSNCSIQKLTLSENIRFFTGWSSLKHVVAPESNPYLASQDGVLYNKSKTKIYRVPESIEGSLTLPNTLTSIAPASFQNCKLLTSVVIPNSVISIENNAFMMCENLASVVIPNSVISIGSLAFYRCHNLTSVTFDNPNGWTVRDDDNQTVAIESAQLSDPAQAASLLNQYCYCAWTRSDN